MRELTVILAYYLNPGMLQRQYETFRSLPDALRAHLRLIVVDDGSPEHPATPEDIGLPLEIYRIGVDVRWNQDAARNLGVDRSQTRWLLLTDIDHLIPQKTIESVCIGKIDASKVYRFSRVSAPDLAPYKPHPNSWLMTRKMYDVIGGYDERLAGNYGTDGDFRHRVASHAEEIVILPDVLIRVPREVIPDASTTTLTRKEDRDGNNIRRIISDRALMPRWRPLRLSFPWTKVH